MSTERTRTTTTKRDTLFIRTADAADSRTGNGGGTGEGDHRRRQTKTRRARANVLSCRFYDIFNLSDTFPMAAPRARDEMRVRLRLNIFKEMLIRNRRLENRKYDPVILYDR